MEVCLTIPEDLIKYIEYIPAETLPSVLIDLIRDGICKSKAKEAVVSNVDITALFSLLQQGLSVEPCNVTKPDSLVSKDNEQEDILKVKKTSETEFIQPKVDIVSVSDDFGDDDNLDDFEAFMK